jgi:imidazolonepropionase-like amidohydrolase
MNGGSGERGIVLAGGRLIDGTGREAISGAVVVIEEGWIARVGRVGELEMPPGAEVIDVSGKTVIPGLINCHTHLCLDGSADPIGAWKRRSITENVLLAAQHAEATLKAGITTVRDLGGFDGADLELKKAIASGLIPGPRMLASGRSICMTGGHGHNMGREVDGPDEARKGAREQLKAGADVIKVMATGGVMTKGVEPGAAQLTEEEMRAAIEEAHKAGKRTATHAQGTEGIKNAIRAGVDSIEHGFFLDTEAIKMMLERGTVFVPTLAAIREVQDRGEESGVPGYMLEKARRINDAHLDSFRRAYEAGVIIAAGNDGGTPLNLSWNLANELAYMVEAGMFNAEALAAAHMTAASLLGLADEIGSIEPGKVADVVVLDGDPLADIAAVRRVSLVIKGGERVDL